MKAAASILLLGILLISCHDEDVPPAAPKEVEPANVTLWTIDTIDYAKGVYFTFNKAWGSDSKSLFFCGSVSDYGEYRSHKTDYIIWHYGNGNAYNVAYPIERSAGGNWFGGMDGMTHNSIWFNIKGLAGGSFPDGNESFHSHLLQYKDNRFISHDFYKNAFYDYNIKDFQTISDNRILLCTRWHIGSYDGSDWKFTKLLYHNYTNVFTGIIHTPSNRTFLTSDRRIINGNLNMLYELKNDQLVVVDSFNTKIETKWFTLYKHKTLDGYVFTYNDKVIKHLNNPLGVSDWNNGTYKDFELPGMKNPIRVEGLFSNTLLVMDEDGTPFYYNGETTRKLEGLEKYHGRLKPMFCNGIEALFFIERNSHSEPFMIARTKL